MVSTLPNRVGLPAEARDFRGLENLEIAFDCAGAAAPAAPIRLLTFTTLYPGATQPNHGIFVENRLRHLVASRRVRLQVVAPVPWFPFTASLFGRYAAAARMPRRETRNGIDVVHPRYIVLPKFGMSLIPLSLYLSVLPLVRRCHLVRILTVLFILRYLYLAAA